MLAAFNPTSLQPEEEFESSEDSFLFSHRLLSQWLSGWVLKLFHLTIDG